MGGTGRRNIGRQFYRRLLCRVCLCLPLLLFTGFAPAFAPAFVQAAPAADPAQNSSAFSGGLRLMDSRMLRPNFSPPKRREAEASPAFSSVFIPGFFDARERLPRPDLSGIVRLRFLAAADFYPFNYTDSRGNLSGYNIDLARALCAELRLENICRIETAPWEQLAARLRAGQADALIAGLAPAAENRLCLSFSRVYMRFPARFLARSDSALIKESAAFTRSGGGFADFIAAKGSRLKIGAVRNTGHEKMLEAYFAAGPADGGKPPRGSNPQLIAYPNQTEMIKALKAGDIDLAFGDGMRFSMLLNAQSGSSAAFETAASPAFKSEPPLRFIGAAYYGTGALLGQGMRIAVTRDNARLAAAFDYALWQLERRGRLAELYLRWFPIGFY